MKFLIVAQDLRVSGTSEGIVSRSFLAKLRAAYPQSIIDVVYLKRINSNDHLHLLPVDSIKEYLLDLNIPFFIKWFNKIYWRIFHISLTRNYIDKVYGAYIEKIEYQKYDYIFIRSSGLDYETILGAKKLPILKKAIVNFHDPYPIFWNAGSNKKLSSLELFKLKKMFKVVSQAKGCMSPSGLLSDDICYLYGSRKKIYILPHQYSETVFNLSNATEGFKNDGKIMISYHGAIQFGRNIDILLDAYKELVENNTLYKENTEFVLRLKGFDNERLIKKYSKIHNIVISDNLDFYSSSLEQRNDASILIVLENGSIYSNILVGKAPFLASIQKPILSISPERSEIRRIIKDNKYIASNTNKDEIKQKLENLIIDRIASKDPVYPFGDYFSDENFKKMLDNVLFESKEEYKD
jgi:hypothetical protein